jgi:RNAse (barnase) inhibitor barstar
MKGFPMINSPLNNFAMKRVIIDGNNFSTLMEFYDEIEKAMAKDLDWNIGRNLDAFDDLLSGGFGVHELNEPIEIIWKNSEKSKTDLGIKETVQYLHEKITKRNSHHFQKNLDEIKAGKGETLFQIITNIINDSPHVQLILM